MATTSEVKAGLDEISAMIKASRQRIKSAKETIKIQETNLNAIPTRFTDVLKTINEYKGSDAFEDLCKAELAKMTLEFRTLVSDVAIASTDLGKRTEF